MKRWRVLVLGLASAQMALACFYFTFAFAEPQAQLGELSAEAEAALRKFVAGSAPSFNATRQFSGSTTTTAQASTVTSLNPELAESLKMGIAKQYRISTEPDRIIAERKTVGLRFTPSDGWRYTQVLWIDQEFGVVLKSSHWRGSELIAEMQVQRIAFDPKPTQPQAGLPVVPSFSIRNVPAGFVLIGVNASQNRAQHIYSDGLAQVSVFIQATGQLPGYGESRRSSTTLVSKRHSNVDLIAVGEVPATTLERFLSGIDVVR